MLMRSPTKRVDGSCLHHWQKELWHPTPARWGHEIGDSSESSHSHRDERKKSLDSGS